MGIAEAMPLARAWAHRQLRGALASQPKPGTVVSGVAAVRVLSEVREHLIGRCRPIINAYCSTRWLWHLRRTDFDIVRGYLPNTATSIIRIAENLSGSSELHPDDERVAVETPLNFLWDAAVFARVARLLAMSELINHSEGWLRRSSKGAEFEMREGDLPDLVANDELEAAIDLYDERVVAAASYRWHPNLAAANRSASEPLLLTVSMLLEGIGDTPMWRGSLAEGETFVIGEGRFAFDLYALSDQSNAAQLRGPLEAMEAPQIAASLVLLAQALGWHATFYADTLGVNVPRVGYVFMLRALLVEHIEKVLALAADHMWPAMDGFLPESAAAVLADVQGMDDNAAMSAPGPVIRPWTNDVLLVDVHAMTVNLMHLLRMAPSTDGPRANATAFAFEEAVQRLIDDGGVAPAQPTRALRGKTLRARGESVTDLDALMVVGTSLVCVSCKKVELARPYDAGDYQMVRNAKTKVANALSEWADRMAKLNADPVGDNYDFSSFERILGVVVTPELVFISSPSALAEVQLTDSVTTHAYISYGELSNLVDRLRD